MNSQVPSPVKQLFNPIRELAENGKLSGLLLILATVISLLFSNSSNASNYLRIWESEIGPDFLSKSILHWINDGLMPVFFLLVGFEIKRELRSGELSGLRQAILPGAAALGGVIVPALIYVIFHSNHPETLHGWAIPTATDIPFSLGLLALLGSRVPFSLKIFLTALAIIDDLAAILIIALFYSSGLVPMMLLLSGVVFLALMALNFFKVRFLFPYLILGAFLWYFILKSGIHPTISGVILAFCIPVSLAEKLEEKLTRLVYYFILPLFALANTAIPLSFDISSRFLSPLSLGIIFGLWLGKPVGIIVVTYVMVKLKIGEMLKGVNWKQMTGLGMLAGIGFTMSIFIASLSFPDGINSDIAKLAVIGGSLLSSLSGLFLLWISLRKTSPT